MVILDYVADHTKRLQTISWSVSTCHGCFDFVGKIKQTHTLWTFVCVQVSMYGLKQKKTHTRCGNLCPSVHVWTVRSYKTSLLCLVLGTIGHFVASLFYVQPRKTDSHTGKKTPKFMDKSSHKVRTYGRSHTKPDSHIGKIHPNLWTKEATGHRFVGPSAPNMCVNFGIIITRRLSISRWHN